MSKIDVKKINRVEIKTTSLIGEFDKTFMEDLTITNNSIHFKHYGIDPTKTPIEWSSKSNTNERFIHYYLFLEILILEMRKKKFHEKKEFTKFRISLYEDDELVFKKYFIGTFHMNKLDLAGRMLDRMIPDCEVKPMYLLSEIEYELEAEDFGDELVTEEEIKES